MGLSAGEKELAGRGEGGLCSVRLCAMLLYRRASTVPTTRRRRFIREEEKREGGFVRSQEGPILR